MAGAITATSPSSAATPKLRFIWRTSLSSSRFRDRGRKTGLAVESLQSTPRVVRGRGLAGDPALAVDLVIVSGGDGRIGLAEQAAQHPARTLCRRQVDQVRPAVEGQVAREVSLVGAGAVLQLEVVHAGR